MCTSVYKLPFIPPIMILEIGKVQVNELGLEGDAGKVWKELEEEEEEDRHGLSVLKRCSDQEEGANDQSEG